MFLPSVNLPTIKKVIIFSPLPEWRYFSAKFKEKKRFRWLNIDFKLVSSHGLICGPVLSSPILALLIEFLKEKGLKELLFLGWAGKSPYSSLEIGSLFLPERAQSLEGTSKFYFKRKRIFKPEKTFLQQMKDLFKKFKIPFEKGSILTVDAPKQVEENLNHFRLFLMRNQAMDMETSTLYALSYYYQIRALALHFITDEIGKTSFMRPESNIKILREKLITVLRTFIEND